MFHQVILICAVVVSINGNSPQVYETVEDHIQSETNTRVARDPFNPQKSKHYKPPVFKYESAIQQDPRKHRYVQQQVKDMENIARKNKLLQNREAPSKLSLVQNRKVVDPTPSSSVINENYAHPEKESNNSEATSHYENLKSKENLKRGDQNSSQIVYVNPEVIKQHFPVTPGELNMNDLNTLLQQLPNSRVEGLKKLLTTSSSNLVLPPIKGPLPRQAKDQTLIAEQSVGVPSFQIKPNSKIEDSIQSLQNQLDENIKIQLQKALAKAEEAARAHVDEQHKAIAQAQVEARQKALAIIALHNEGHQTLPTQAWPLNAEASPSFYSSSNTYKNQEDIRAHSKDHQASSPLALPLKAEASTNWYAPSHLHKTENPIIKIQSNAAKTLEKIKAQEEVRVHMKAQKNAQVETRQKTLSSIVLHNQVFPALSLKPEASSNLYAPSHTHKTQTPIIKIQTKKPNSVTQGTRSPNAYQEVISETQHQDQKVFPGVNYHELDENVDNHQYAARYAFGYRIRDVKSGNDFGHEEMREGKNTQGHYHVLLPDGRLQKVEYHADPTGYHAKVTYENLAKHH